MTLKVILQLQAFSSAIRRTFCSILPDLNRQRARAIPKRQLGFLFWIVLGLHESDDQSQQHICSEIKTWNIIMSDNESHLPKWFYNNNSNLFCHKPQVSPWPGTWQFQIHMRSNVVSTATKPGAVTHKMAQNNIGSYSKFGQYPHVLSICYRNTRHLAWYGHWADIRMAESSLSSQKTPEKQPSSSNSSQ